MSQNSAPTHPTTTTDAQPRPYVPDHETRLRMLLAHLDKPDPDKSSAVVPSLTSR